jgi:hypothetical protein
MLARGGAIWATTYTNGVPIGTTPVTTAILPNEIRKGLATLAAEPREVDPGGTRSRFPALRRDRVFRRNSDTPITVSDSRDPQTHETLRLLGSSAQKHHPQIAQGERFTKITQ